jgi:hypothetical protein
MRNDDIAYYYFLFFYFSFLASSTGKGFRTIRLVREALDRTLLLVVGTLSGVGVCEVVSPTPSPTYFAFSLSIVESLETSSNT